MTDSTTGTRTPARRRNGWRGFAVAAVFGLLFAYDLWEAVQNAIELPKLYAQLEAVGLPAGDVPWVLICIGILIPPVAYVGALLIGLRRSVGGKALVFLLALVLVAALSLSVNALAVA
jgi:hypothetical protein